MVVIGSTFSVFFENIINEIDWSRGQVSKAFSLFLLSTVIGLPLIGRLVDRYGSRQVIIPCVVVFGFTLFTFKFFQSNLHYFYLIFIVIGLIAGGTSTLPYFKVITRSFTRRRGLALGIANSGTGVGQFVLPYLAFLLISAYGWRDAYAITGLVVMFITIPLVHYCLNEKYRYQHTSENTTAPDNEVGMELGEALHSRDFWLIGVAFFLGATTLLGYLIHMVPLLTDRGLSAQSAALAASAFGFSQLLGRLLAGVLLDRFFAPYVIASMWLVSVLIFLLLWSGVDGYMLFICTALLGFAWGGEGDVLAYMVSRYFGLRKFGSIYSLLLTMHMLGGVAGPWLMGSSFDELGSYTLILGGMAVIMSIAAVLILQMQHYPKLTELAPKETLTHE
jgi:MFS family permease